MEQHALESIIREADDAISREDFDALMDFYDEAAALVVRPGVVAKGKTEIRKAFEAIAAYFDHGLSVRQGEMRVIEAGDTALVVAHTIVSAKTSPDPSLAMERKATYVFRKDDGGTWRCLIDNSYGTELLAAEP